MSGSEKRERLPAGLGKVGRELKRWRARKRGGERIPEEVWSAAVAASHEYGVNRVSRALGLAYYDLKKRVEAESERSTSGQGKSSPQFVELELTRPAGSGCVVELAKGNGTRLRISTGDGVGVDWDRVTAAFLEA